MTITSSAFEHNQRIPSKFTCDGANINPPLTFADVPDEAKSLVLIVDDPDAPSGLFTHWTLYNMSPATQQISENAMSGTGTQGRNDFDTIRYNGPCPPDGTHRYFFRLLALSTSLNLPEGAERQILDKSMEQHIVSKAELIGLYDKVASP